MPLIVGNELNLNVIKEIFETSNLTAELNDEDGFVEVKYPEELKLILWIKEPVIRMRMLLLPRKERDLFQRAGLLLELASKLNQQGGCNGTVDVENLLGITLEYRLPYKGGILSETILQVGEMLVEGAGFADHDIKWDMRRLSAE